MIFNNKLFILVLVLLLIFCMGNVSANEFEDTNLTDDMLSVEQDNILHLQDWSIDEDSESVEYPDDNLKMVEESDDLLRDDESDAIVVSNWDELQYYCSLKDDDYTLKLKENTNFYPTNPKDSNYQIKIYNNVKIIGSNGSYIGDKSSSPAQIKYTAIIVPDDVKASISLENVTFKWINTLHQPDGLFLQMGGKGQSVIKNCLFTSIRVDYGHASIIYLKKGAAILDNCSFIKCNSAYGVISVYDPDSVKSTNMIVRNCYFEGNYASVEPGCINNCGKLTVYNTTFVKNRSFSWAGAIHTHNHGNTTIYDSNFTDNVAGWNGGALYTYSYLQIYNTVFVGNNCTTNNGGGAIGACDYISNPHIYIEGCLFKDNNNNCWALDELSTYGTGRGGAISLMDAGSIEVRDTTFIANSASIGTAICAIAVGGYGSPDIVIVNNSFINHTRAGDVLNISYWDTICNISGNYYEGNSIVFSNLTLVKLSEGKEQATLEISAIDVANPSYYDEDILDKTLFDVYVNDVYVKTIDSKIFTVDFDEEDICNVYVIPTISNRKSNNVTVYFAREYIYVSKSSGNDSFDGLTRDTPVYSIKRALELASLYQCIVLLDGVYDEGNLTFDYDLSLKGEGNATLTNSTSFTANSNNFIIKNINIVNLTGNTFIEQKNGNLIVKNCVFNNNDVSILIDANVIDIEKSMITNNNVVVYNHNFTTIKNSVLLNNSKIIDNNINDVNLNYNWWGNTLNNIYKPTDLNISNWIIINATCSADAIECGQSSVVQFDSYLFEDNHVRKYSDLIMFDLEVSALNGNVSKNSLNYKSNVIYTLTDYSDGILTARYNDIIMNITFGFLKYNPHISIKASDIMYGQSLTVTVSTPKGVTGSIRVKVGGSSKVNAIRDGLTFTFKDLNAGVYDLVAVYSGNDIYASQTINLTVNVKKYDSQTSISVGSIEVGCDLVFTVTTTKSSTGNVTFSINNKTETLFLTNNQATYTLKNVSRGDYSISAVYNGNEKYSSSRDTMFLEVDNLVPLMDVAIENSTYGEAAIVDVVLNDDATGIVIATVDGITNSSYVVDGKSKVYIYGVEVGINRNVTIFYTGDNAYFNRTVFSTMNVSRANFTFSMTSKDVYIGDDAVVVIVVPPKTKGNFTINGVVLPIPMSGEVSYIIPDLEVGNYEVSAIFNGDNYNSVQNTTSFSVLEYVSPQWGVEGGNTQNTQKSEYISKCDGDILWYGEINGTIINNLIIDREGNVYVVASSGIYSYDVNGSLRWVYQSDGRLGNFSGLAIGRDVIVSPREGDTLYLINQEDGSNHGFLNIFQASSLYAPIMDLNATIYTVSEYQVESSGYNLVVTPFKTWVYGGNPILVSLGSTIPMASPTINDDIIVVLGENHLMIFDADTLSANSIKIGNFKNVKPIIGEGNIIYAILGDSIVGYGSDGTQFGRIFITGGSGNVLALDNELGVYATNAAGNLYRYDFLEGSESLISTLNITSGILIDANSNLYFGCNNLFYCINPEGNVLWKSDLSSKIISSPVLGENGVIYVATNNNKLFALSDVSYKDSNLEVTVNDIVQGQSAVFNIKLDGQATGNVSFAINGVNYDEVIADGTIVKVIPNLPVGTYNVNVTYGGDLRFNKTSKVVTFTVKAKPAPVISNPVLKGSDITVLYTSNSYYKVKLTQNNAPLAGKTVAISFNGANYNVITDKNGIASFKITAKPGKYTIKATYNNKTTKNTVTVKSILQAKNLKVKKSAKTAKIKVTLKKVNNKYLKGKTLKLKINKKTLKAKTNKKGVATFKLSKSILKKLKKAKKYTYTVTYLKDSIKKSLMVK